MAKFTEIDFLCLTKHLIQHIYLSLKNVYQCRQMELLDLQVSN